MQNLLKPNVNQYPFWYPSGVQYPNGIVSRQVEAMIQDINVNQIPMETDYNQNQLSAIPTPTSARQDVESATWFQPYSPVVGVGSGIGLIELMMNSVNEQAQKFNNQEG